MSAIHWLAASASPSTLPSALEALDEPNGLLAAGGSLEPEWLLRAYTHGIFPWYETGQPILWWSPDPRAVLWPDDLHVSRSLRRLLRKSALRVTADSAFDDVVTGCAAPRSYTESTWITPEMARAYSRLHRLGLAHSFETWQGDRLVGGLYGVAIGSVFFGESMFSRARDASKVALVRGIEFLKRRGFTLIDCQVASAHMTRLGATDMPRAKFVDYLRLHCIATETPQSWREDFDAFARDVCGPRGPV
jgi:leucyl/phenylalanyl-tRNA--protein transferase